MSQNPLQIPLMKLGRIIVGLKPVLIDAIGVEAERFIDDNFAKQGFQGATFQRWPKRKKAEKGAARAILIKTGNLRRSIRRTNGPNGVTISSDVPYAKIHNEGGDVRHPSRAVILSYQGTKGGKLKLGKVQTESQQRQIKELRRATIGEHVTKMPARPFAKDSPVLTKRCEKAVLMILKPALNNL